MKKVFFLFAFFAVAIVANAAYFELRVNATASGTQNEVRSVSNVTLPGYLSMYTEAAGYWAFASATAVTSTGYIAQKWSHGWYNSGNGGYYAEYPPVVVKSVRVTAMVNEYGYTPASNARAEAWVKVQ